MLTAFLLMITAGNLAAHGVIDVTPGFIETWLGVICAKRIVGRASLAVTVNRVSNFITRVSK